MGPNTRKGHLLLSDLWFFKTTEETQGGMGGSLSRGWGVGGGGESTLSATSA